MIVTICHVSDWPCPEKRHRSRKVFQLAIHPPSPPLQISTHTFHCLNDPEQHHFSPHSAQEHTIIIIMRAYIVLSSECITHVYDLCTPCVACRFSMHMWPRLKPLLAVVEGLSRPLTVLCNTRLHWMSNEPIRDRLLVYRSYHSNTRVMTNIAAPDINPCETRPDRV